MKDEMTCQLCGAPLEYDVEFEHKTCMVCMGFVDEYEDGDDQEDQEAIYNDLMFTPAEEHPE